MENLLTCQTNSLNLFFKKIVGAPETTEFVCGLMINKLIERYPASRGYIFAVWAVWAALIIPVVSWVVYTWNRQLTCKNTLINAVVSRLMYT